MIFSHRANHPAHFGSTQPSQLSREAKVYDLDPEIVLGTTHKHDVVGLDVHVNDSLAVHEADCLEDLGTDHFALVLTQLVALVGDGVEEVTAGQVLGDDAALVDALVILQELDYEGAAPQLPEDGDLGGRDTSGLIISDVLKLVTFR